jgi:hypothetical protein
MLLDHGWNVLEMKSQLGGGMSSFAGMVDISNYFIR